ncbi:MAG: 7-carboxy-7-deazaguanine synthase QueE [Gammaproteobacteria bacterium]
MAGTPATAPASSRDALAAVLKVNEIFLSLQGETSLAGLPTVRYCDTEYAFYEGEKMTVAAILRAVAGYRTRHVTVTGGEPLAQKDCLALLRHLCDEGYRVSLETGGALDISDVDPRVVKILDLKTPGSGEMERNLYDNINHLGEQDQVKFVICDRADYDWARDILNRHRLNEHCEVLFSPAHGELDAAQLADWILEDRLPVRLQIQLHKHLWGDVPGK